MIHAFRSYDPVFRAWATQDRDYGYCGAVSFRGTSFYSYNFHIAEIYPDKRVALVLMPESTRTTNSHNDAARWAARSAGYTVLHVADVTADHAANFQYWLRKLKQTVLAFDRAVFYGSWWLIQNHRDYTDLVQYCKVFGIKPPCTLGLYLDPGYPFIKRRFVTVPIGNRENTIELFLPKWLAKKGIENVEPKDILKTRNADVRREIIRRLGIERICHKLGAQTIDQRDNYQLILLDLRDGRHRPFLKMHNPSVPEIWHVEGVHPACKTVQDAINYRRYGEAMFEDLTWSNREEWEYWRDIQRHPEKRRIKPEYQTTPLEWTPSILT